MSYTCSLFRTPYSHGTICPLNRHLPHLSLLTLPLLRRPQVTAHLRAKNPIFVCGRPPCLILVILSVSSQTHLLRFHEAGESRASGFLKPRDGYIIGGEASVYISSLLHIQSVCHSESVLSGDTSSVDEFFHRLTSGQRFGVEIIDSHYQGNYFLFLEKFVILVSPV